MENNQLVNILIVDDSPDKLLALEAILEDLGQNLVKARSGREALRYLLLQDFAVILLDVNMPDIDGFETAALIRQRKRSEDTPIIFITAFGDDSHVWRGYSLGAVDYILTPVVPEVLRAKVAVFVELFQKTELIRQQAEQRIEFVREQAARTAAEEATHYSTFLAEASRVLARSLDYTTTIASTARLAIPTLADLCIVSVVESGGQPVRIERASSESRWQAPLQEASTLAVEDWITDTTGSVLSTGKTQQFSTDEWSAMVAPLVARGVTLGTMSVARFDRSGSYDARDLRLAEDLADRAAIAIDNARLYQEIRQGDRRKDEFLAMLAHELRNPLGAISTALQCMELDAQDKDTRVQTRGILRRQVDHMTRLVDDLLDVSRITRGKIQLRKEVLDLAAVIERAVACTNFFITSRAHQLSIRLPAEPVRLRADPTRIEQVLCNLLHNAAKYSDAGGQITLSVEVDSQSAVIRVKDAGIGIPADLLPRVFDLFAQADRSLDRSQGGLGIGLTLARSLVALHGGQIEVFSAGLGQGSEFTVRLPLWKEPAGTRLQTASSQPDCRDAAIRPRRILVVDDNNDLAAVLAALLNAAGHEVHLASNGPEAIEMMATAQMDVAVIDIGLPGMSGYDLARRLRRQPASAATLLIAMTGYGQAEDRRRSKEAGFDHHLVKPASFHKLQELLSSTRTANSSPCLAVHEGTGET